MKTKLILAAAAAYLWTKGKKKAIQKTVQQVAEKLKAYIVLEGYDSPYNPSVRQKGYLYIKNLTNEVVRMKNVHLTILDRQITQQGKEITDASTHINLSFVNPYTDKQVQDTDEIVVTPGSLKMPISLTSQVYAFSDGDVLTYSSDFDNYPLSINLLLTYTVEGQTFTKNITATYTSKKLA